MCGARALFVLHPLQSQQEEEEEDHVFLTQNIGDLSPPSSRCMKHHSQDTFVCVTSEPSSSVKTTRKSLPPNLTVLEAMTSTTAEIAKAEDEGEKAGLKRGQKAFPRNTPHPPLTTRSLQNLDKNERCNKQPMTNQSRRFSSHTGHTKRATDAPVQCSSRSTNGGGSSGRRVARCRGMNGENDSNKLTLPPQRGQLSDTPPLPTSKNRQPRRPSSGKPSKLLEGWTRAFISEEPDAEATSAAGTSRLTRTEINVLNLKKSGTVNGASKHAASEKASRPSLCPSEADGTSPEEEQIIAVHDVRRQSMAANRGSLAAFEEYDRESFESDTTRNSPAAS